MKSRFEVLAVTLLVGACSSGGTPVPTPAPPPQPVVPATPVKIVIRDLEPEPLPDVRCDQITSLAEAGDFKPAADEMDQIEDDGAFCHEEAVLAANASRGLVAEADALIHRSTEKKRLDDIPGARADLEAAIAVYPKYYWAKKLLRDLGGGLVLEGDQLAQKAPVPQERTHGGRSETPPSPERGRNESEAGVGPDVEADVEVIRQLIAEQNLELARIAEQDGDLEGASRWALTAIKAEPEDLELKQGIVEYARLLGLKFFSAGELSPAREIWGAAFALDGSDARLRDYLRQVDERLANLEQIRAKGGSR